MHNQKKLDQKKSFETPRTLETEEEKRRDKLDLTTITDIVPTLKLTQNVMSQIYKMHIETPEDNEFSAALIYQVTDGSINDLDNLELTTIGIYPLDMGNGAYTGAEMKDSLADILEEYPEFIESGIGDVPITKMGLLHTHHSMDVYFSSTDISELKQTSPDHNYYLSMIVNYAGDIKAKLAFHTKETSSLSQKGDDGEWKDSNIKIEKEVIIAYDLAIECDSIFSDKFLKRVSELKQNHLNRNTRYLGNRTAGYHSSGWDNLPLIGNTLGSENTFGLDRDESSLSKMLQGMEEDEDVRIDINDISKYIEKLTKKSIKKYAAKIISISISEEDSPKDILTTMQQGDSEIYADYFEREGKTFVKNLLGNDGILPYLQRLTGISWYLEEFEKSVELPDVSRECLETVIDNINEMLDTSKQAYFVFHRENYTETLKRMRDERSVKAS